MKKDISPKSVLNQMASGLKYAAVVLVILLGLGMAFFRLSSEEYALTMPPPQDETLEFIDLCARAEPEIIRQALADGADVNAVWDRRSRVGKTRPIIYEGQTALEVAVTYNLNLESIKLLLAAGADVNAHCGGPLRSAVRRDNPALVSLLLEHGARVNEQSDWQEDILFSAIYNTAPEILEQLITAGADASVVMYRGETLLHYAASLDSVAPLEILLKAGLDPNVTDEDGDTPLHESIQSPLVVEILARAGADVNLENNYGYAPYEFTKDPAIIDAFMAAGARPLVPLAEGGVKARGFGQDWSGHSRTRFFSADDSEPLVPLEIGEYTPLQEIVLASVDLESSRRVEQWEEKLKFSEKVRWSAEGTDDPIQYFTYCLETRAGALAYGRTDLDGCTVRLYTPEAEDLLWEAGMDAVEAVEGFIESGRTNYLFEDEEQREVKYTGADPAVKHGERICFVHPEKRLPVWNYPYFVASDQGYAMFGKSGLDGCTAELFVPHPGTFSVYGGLSARRQNVNGPSD